MEMKNIGLVDALFTKGQQRVLGLLFGQPERSFFANEIIRHVASGAGAIHRELERLTHAGVLTAHRVGNQRHFQANHACPIFEELRSITRKTFGLANVLRDALMPFSADLSLAFVYGSVARGEERVASDIDLFILTDKLTYPDIFPQLAEAEKKLGRTVNPTLYKMTELRRKIDESNAFVTRVLAQPKLFIFGSEDDISKSA